MTAKARPCPRLLKTAAAPTLAKAARPSARRPGAGFHCRRRHLRRHPASHPDCARRLFTGLHHLWTRGVRGPGGRHHACLARQAVSAPACAVVSGRRCVAGLWLSRFFKRRHADRARLPWRRGAGRAAADDRNLRGPVRRRETGARLLGLEHCRVLHWCDLFTVRCGYRARAGRSLARMRRPFRLLRLRDFRQAGAHATGMGSDQLGPGGHRPAVAGGRCFTAGTAASPIPMQRR
jgi:hypothetical protein